MIRSFVIDSPFGFRHASFLWVLGGDFGGDAAAGAEVADDGHATGFTARCEIVQNLVSRVFVKNPFVTIALEVKLEGFQFDAELIGTIRDINRTEIGLAGLGAQAGEFRTIDLDIIVPLGMGIFKSL